MSYVTSMMGMLFLLNQVAIMYPDFRLAYLLLLAIERIIVVSQNPP